MSIDDKPERLLLVEPWFTLINNISTDFKDILLSLMTDEMSENLKKISSVPEIYPTNDLIFSCFDMFNFEETKVVILGQDPYINKGEATGMCFVVNEGVKIPPSLRNIYKEIMDDLSNYKFPNRWEHNGEHLARWASRGILLLNASLSVEPKKSGSHMKIWENYTNSIIKYISDNKFGVVFLLWGNFAKSKKRFIDESKHHILEAAHPSPLSANRGGFFGCKHFSNCNNLVGFDIFGDSQLAAEN
tara:strand:- start:1604 stop:2338 length:735 start_codon:yes stop_codon:yes gene_type:complete